MGIAGIILAAGESTRMGRDKSLLPWPPDSALQTAGTTLLSSAIQSLVQHCDRVIVVVGKNEPVLQPVVWACGASLVRNPSPELGQFSSLQTGLREVLNHGWDSAMVTPVDRPPAQDETLSALVDAFTSREHQVWAVVPEYQERHGHPILVGREMIEEFLKTPPTASARDIEHANQQHIFYLPVNDSRVTTNVDTPEDYASLQS
jgi:molybdenum cofactor cytidylyltransferase